MQIILKVNNLKEIYINYCKNEIIILNIYSSIISANPILKFDKLNI